MVTEYNELSGFLLIDKEKGYTSFDVCNKIKHRFRFKKVGHNGTLDPNATGLMLVGVNKATKLLFKLNTNIKEYLATIVFGKKSDTFDVDGDITFFNKDINISEEMIDECINVLKNKKTQIPPIYSAIKVKGQKSYELARKGISIELDPRSVEIYDINRSTKLYLDEYMFKCVEIDMTVSAGFYVRSFVRDLSELLKIPCLLKDLRRVRNGNYYLKNAKKIDEITIGDLFTIDIN